MIITVAFILFDRQSSNYLCLSATIQRAYPRILLQIYWLVLKSFTPLCTLALAAQIFRFQFSIVSLKNLGITLCAKQPPIDLYIYKVTGNNRCI